MGPRSSTLWEFWSLSVWWALWSLADQYLLALTPIPELAILWICIVCAGIAWLARVFSGGNRYVEQQLEEELEMPSPKRITNVLVDAV